MFSSEFQFELLLLAKRKGLGILLQQVKAFLTSEAGFSSRQGLAECLWWQGKQI